MYNSYYNGTSTYNKEQLKYNVLGELVEFDISEI